MFLHVYLQNFNFITSQKAEINTLVEIYNISYCSNLNLGHKCSLKFKLWSVFGSLKASQYQ